MLHTKFEDHRSFGYGANSFFEGCFTIYGHDGHLDHVTQNTPNKHFLPPPMNYPRVIWFDWPSGYGEDGV